MQAVCFERPGSVDIAIDDQLDAPFSTVGHNSFRKPQQLLVCRGRKRAAGDLFANLHGKYLLSRTGQCRADTRHERTVAAESPAVGNQIDWTFAPGTEETTDLVIFSQ